MPDEHASRSGDTLLATGPSGARGAAGPPSMGESTVGGDPDSTWGRSGAPGEPQAAAAVPTVGARFDRFEVVQPLGAGAMGVVVLARDLDLGRAVAIKFLSRRGAGDEAGNLRLLREAQAVARLQHPHVVAVHEVGKLGDQIFVVMEYVDGGTLRQWCAAGTRTWQDVVEVYRQAALGLEAAHAAGLVHRDFKPDNALIGRDGRVRVSDFGLVSAALGEPAATAGAMHDVTLTRTGAVLGTPAYMAPEQFAGGHVGPAADQFALCVALFEALYGTRPFAGSHFMEILDAIESGTMRTHGRADVPMTIHGAIIRGLAKDPAQRHPSMQALADALRPRAPVPPRRSQAPLVAGVAVAAAVVIGAGATAWWWFAGGTPSDPTPPTIAQASTSTPAPSSLCDARAQADAAWTAGHATVLRAAFTASGSAFAADAAARTIVALDGHMTALRETIATACASPESDPVRTRRAQACVGNALDAFAGAVDTLSGQPTAAMVEVSHVVAMGLPTPTRCGAGQLLDTDGPPPLRSPAELSEVRRRVWTAFTLLQTGELDRAAAELEGAREPVAALDDAGLDALWSKVNAHLAAARGDAVGSEGALREARAHARAASDRTLEAIVLADLLRATATGLGRLAEAEAIAAQLRSMVPSVAADSRWYVHGALGQFAQAAGRLPEAEQAASAEIEALADLPWRRGALAGARLRRAQLRLHAGRAAEAVADAEQGLAELEKEVGARSVMFASSQCEVALLFAASGDLVGARQRVDAARAVLSQATPSRQLTLADTLIQLAEFERAQDDLAGAARRLRDALTIAERTGDLERVARTSIEIALVEYVRADYVTAEAALERASALADRFPQSPQIDRARMTQIRAGIAYAAGKLDDAVGFHTQRLGLVEARAGAISFEVANARVDLADLYVVMGACDKAEIELGHAVRIRESLGAGDDLDRARILTDRATCLARDGDAWGAREHARQAAAIPATVVPPVFTAPRIAMVEAELARVTGDDAAARTHAESARTQYEAIGPAAASQRRDVDTWIEDNLGAPEPVVHADDGATP